MTRVALLTREYPPEVYGGAGVHVEYLAAQLRQRVELEVHCFGQPRAEAGVTAHRAWEILREPQPEAAALQVLSTDLAIVAAVSRCRLVHSHTWYANLAGHLAKLAWGAAHVLTTHSLEPLRPWKVEQLGGGYAISSFCERTALLEADAVIAVSEAMREDVVSCYPDVDPARIHVIPNGIDPERFHPDRRSDALRRHGVDGERPYAIFVGRITRQKGLTHLLRAAHHLDRSHQLVVCAGAPDTPELAAEVEALAQDVRRQHAGLVWIAGMLPREELLQLLTAATVFVCPSVYEPFGLVNLEAMACETAVVATRIGGIPEVVVDGETGVLVDYDPGAEGAFARDLAAAIEGLLRHPDRAHRMGAAGRRRILEKFTWSSVADQTVALYRRVLA